MIEMTSNSSIKLSIIFSVAIVFPSGYANSQDKGKDKKDGIISFMAPQNIYVKFETTEGITAGDTIYAEIGGKRNAGHGCQIPIVTILRGSKNSQRGTKSRRQSIRLYKSQNANK